MGRSRLFHTIVIAGTAITGGPVVIAGAMLPAVACESDQFPTIQCGPCGGFDMIAPGGWADIGMPADLAVRDIGGWPDIGMPDLAQPDLAVQDVGSWPDIGIPPDMAKKD